MLLREQQNHNSAQSMIWHGFSTRQHLPSWDGFSTRRDPLATVSKAVSCDVRVSGRQANGGFTLIELLLAVSLVLLISGAIVFNFTNLARGSQLEQGTARLETLMRYAQAQAANSGRKVQLVFASEVSSNSTSSAGGEVRATWEPDPLGRPGYFDELAEAFWHTQEINNLVQVEGVHLLSPNGSVPEDSFEDEVSDDAGTNTVTAKVVPPITFYPDGSSDSAEIILASRTTEEAQRMAVRIMGITGSISHQLVSAELDEFLLFEDEMWQDEPDPWQSTTSSREAQTEQPRVTDTSGSHSSTNSLRGLRDIPRTPAQSNSVERVP